MRAGSPRPRWCGLRSASPPSASSASWSRCRGTTCGSRSCRGRRPRSPSPQLPACPARAPRLPGHPPRPPPPRAVTEVRALVALVVVAITVVVQLTIVDRIAFPGGAGPNLVLLAVAALAVAGGPMVGVLTGFLAGLALDVAPP